MQQVTIRWELLKFKLFFTFLGMITPLTDELASHAILGVLLCFRSIVPNLSDENKLIASSLKDSFGVNASGTYTLGTKAKIIEKKQFLQVDINFSDILVYLLKFPF